MITVTRKLEFDAGHRLLGHEGKCAHYHGHRFAVLITVQTDPDLQPGLDSVGRVIDFGCIKEKVGYWIDEKLDHNMILHRDDPLRSFLDYGIVGGYGKKPYIMPNGENPTSENIAKLICDESFNLLPKEVLVTQVEVYETPNCSAIYVPNS
jgi:6-pyruvoyltetrahydropterin/6-carboxytetrahydropterin synthase